MTYHGVVDNKDTIDSVDISTGYFEKQMKYLKKHGYKTLTMKEFQDWKNGKIDIPRKSVLITFDDGWENNYTNALPILEKYDINATVFVIWSRIDRANWDEESPYMNINQVKDIEKNHKNLNVQSHSYDMHIIEKAKSENYKMYDEDIKTVKKDFSDKMKYYAYPFGINNENYKKALKDNDYQMAFTFGPHVFAKRSDDNYAIPRLGVYETTKFWKFKLKLFLKI